MKGMPAEMSFVVPFSMMASPGDMGTVLNPTGLGARADMIRELATLLLATLLSKPDREDTHSTVILLSTSLQPASLAVNVDAAALNGYGYLTASASLAATGLAVNFAA